MPFNILSIPFFAGVDAFESGNYALALPHFLKAAQAGNWPALFYIKEMRDKKLVTIPEAESDVIKAIDDRIARIPESQKSEAWCKASVIIRDFNSKPSRSTTKRKKEARDYNVLLGFGSKAPNAVVFLFKQGQIREIDPLMMADLYILHHLKDSLKNPIITLELGFLEKCAQMIEKMPSFAERGGAVEEYIVKQYERSKDNPNRFNRWTLSAAQMGSARIQYWVATFMIPREGKLEVERRQIVALAALAGDPDALLELGIRDFQMQSPNYDNIRVCLERGLSKMANGPNPIFGTHYFAQAHYILGNIFANGLGSVKRDPVKADNHYYKAKELGNLFAAWKWVDLRYPDNDGLDVNPEVVLATCNKIIHALNQCKAQGKSTPDEQMLSTYVHVLLGDMNLKGYGGLTANPIAALKHFQIAAEAGSEEGQLNYAGMLYKQEGITGRVKEGAQQIIASARRGNMTAIKWVSYMLLNREIDPKEFGITREAMEDYFSRTSKTDSEFAAISDIHACLASAYMNNNSFDAPEDFTKVYQYLLKGIELNNRFCWFLRGKLYQTGCPSIPGMEVANSKLAYKHFTKAAELGVANALVAMGFAELNGDGVKKDIIQAESHFRAALEEQRGAAAAGLYFLSNRESEATVDPQFVVTQLKQAEAEGTKDASAIYALGCIYNVGKLVPRDQEAAYQCFEKAAALGSAAAASECAGAKFSKAIRTKHFELLPEVLEHLTLPIQKGISKSIFFKSMVELLLDPERVPQTMEELRNLVSRKPYKRASQVLEYLETHPRVNPLEIILFICANTDNLAEELSKIPKEMDETSPKPKSPAKRESSPAEEKAKREDLTQRRENQLKRLQGAIDKFLDPANKKGVTLSDFEKIITKLGGESGRSKAGKRYVCDTPQGSKRMLFMHSIHRAGRSCRDAIGGDPGRISALRAMVESSRETDGTSPATPSPAVAPKVTSSAAAVAASTAPTHGKKERESKRPRG